MQSKAMCRFGLMCHTSLTWLSALSTSCMPPPPAPAGGAGLAPARSFSSSCDRLAGGGGAAGGPFGGGAAGPLLAAAGVGAGAGAGGGAAAAAAVPPAALAAAFADAMLPPEGFHLTPVGRLMRTKACRPVKRSCGWRPQQKCSRVDPSTTHASQHHSCNNLHASTCMLAQHGSLSCAAMALCGAIWRSTSLQLVQVWYNRWLLA